MIISNYEVLSDGVKKVNAGAEVPGFCIVFKLPENIVKEQQALLMCRTRGIENDIEVCVNGKRIPDIGEVHNESKKEWFLDIASVPQNLFICGENSLTFMAKSNDDLFEIENIILWYKSEK